MATEGLLSLEVRTLEGRLCAELDDVHFGSSVEELKQRIAKLTQIPEDCQCLAIGSDVLEPSHLKGDCHKTLEITLVVSIEQVLTTLTSGKFSACQRMVALSELADMGKYIQGHDSAIDAVLPLFGCAHLHEVAAKCCVRIAKKGDEQTIQKLFTLAEHISRDVRRHALWALFQVMEMGDERMAPAAIKGLQDEHFCVQRAALDIVPHAADRGDESCIAAVIATLDHGDDATRRKALSVLSKIASKEDLMEAISKERLTNKTVARCWKQADLQDGNVSVEEFVGWVVREDLEVLDPELARIIAAVCEVNPEAAGHIQNGVKFGGKISWDLGKSDKVTKLPEIFGDLRLNGDLHTGSSGITCYPESIGNMVIGGNWYAQKNRIEGLPASFGHISVGGSINLAGNRIAELPRSIGHLNVGGSLDISQNEISSLPDDIGMLAVAGSLNLSNNPLCALPAAFESINLNSLDLSGCTSLSPLPEVITGMKIPGKLSLRNMELEELPESFGRLKVGSLSLSGNKLRFLPESFGDMELGADLDLRSNKLCALPRSLLKLCTSEHSHIDLRDNPVATNMPDWSQAHIVDHDAAPGIQVEDVEEYDPY